MKELYVVALGKGIINADDIPHKAAVILLDETRHINEMLNRVNDNRNSYTFITDDPLWFIKGALRDFKDQLWQALCYRDSVYKDFVEKNSRIYYGITKLELPSGIISVSTILDCSNDHYLFPAIKDEFNCYIDAVPEIIQQQLAEEAKNENK